MLRAHAVSEMGSGAPPMVLLHGFGADQTTWRYLAPLLSKTRKVYLYDHMGSGDSELAHYDPERYRTLEGYADDFVEVLEALGLQQVLAVGHSVSGMIALLAALRTERIAGIVMIGASPRYLNDGDYQGGFEPQDIEEFLRQMELDFQGWAKALAPRVLDQPGKAELTQELEYSFCRTNAEILRRFAEATFLSDHRTKLSECPVPALVLQAKADVIVPLAAARFLVEHIPNARLEMLDTRGHYPHLSDPQAVAAAIERFSSGPPFESA